MFSYYGRKKKIVKYYPAPAYDTIIEPFAGSAVYSLYQNNWKKNVIIVDKYDKLIKIWKYLQSAKPEDILKLPDVENGEELAKINGFNELLDEEKWLIGFSVNNGSVTPKNFAGQMNFNSWFRDKKEIANNLYKIKHWDIRNDDYINLDNIKATWFIDPPYQFGGELYKHSNENIDFKSLAKWCKSRNGQVIVCENSKADWLPFTELKKMSGQCHETMEVMYYQDDLPSNGLVTPSEFFGNQDDENW